MNWDAVGALGEIGGLIAVVASLFYVGVQVKQNSSALRGQTFESLSNATNETTKWVLSDAGLADVTTRGLGGETLTSEEAARFRVFTLIVLRHTEAAYYQYQLGLLDTVKLKSLTWYAGSYLGTPLGAELLESTKNRFDEEFISFVEKLITETNPKTHLKILEGDV